MTKQEEALIISEEIIADIELSRLPLANIALKTARVARLLDDTEMYTIFQREVSGYNFHPDGFDKSEGTLLKKAGRIIEKKIGSEVKEWAYGESIEVLEQKIETSKLALSQAIDPSVSVKSSNPNQYVFSPMGNTIERRDLKNLIIQSTSQLAKSRNLIYTYIVNKNLELKYSKINSDIFQRMKNGVDEKIIELSPDIVGKFSSVYENLLSENNEDWSNAVHSCRRILQTLADKLYPPREIIEVNGKKIKLGEEQYINRLIQYIQGKSDSETFNKIVGSQLDYIGDRLDSVFDSTNKGTHTTIETKEEADRYVIYTYMLLNDILSL